VTQAPEPAHARRVLCVDDDRVNLLLFSEACRMAGGVVVETATTGAEALELAAEFKPDLLVIDLHLPDTDGFALLPRLRQATGNAALPAALFSADDPQALAARAAAAGFQHCWAKPVDIRALIGLLSAG
jgi:CheY-like chemotaxis protein